MYIKTNGQSYSCVAYMPNENSVQFHLQINQDVEDIQLGEKVELYQDDGFLLADHVVTDYLRSNFNSNVLTLTNIPCAEPVEEDSGEAIPDIYQLRADIDFLAALQGVTL